MLLHNKRGELTTTQIVGLVVLILSFVIILFLIFQLNLGETTKKEVCRDSVILKGKSLLPTGATALNCQTIYVCFSKTNDCDKLDNPDKIVKVTGRSGLYRGIADEKADCWWEFGEGKINYVASELVPDKYCSFCAQVYFDSSIKELFGGRNNFSQEEIYDFIAKNNMTGSDIGYDEYLYEGIDFKDAKEILSIIDQEGEGGFAVVDLDKTQLIMMAVTSEVSWVTWVAVGVVGAAVTVVAAPVVVAAIGGSSLGLGVLGTAKVMVSVAASSTFKIIALKSTAGLIATGTLVGTGGYYVTKEVEWLYTGTSLVGENGLAYLRPLMIQKDSDTFEQFRCDDIVTRT